jgi:SAM-dependent methyltransferase
MGLASDLKIFIRRAVGRDDHARIFDDHYKSNLWIGGGSGSGSTPEITAEYRNFLVAFLRDHKIKSVVDLGCGDWQFSQMIDWTGIDYTGIDVSGVVLANTKKHARPSVKFIQLDGSRNELPLADLLIAKDVLQHWSNADVSKFIPKMKKFKYALITNGTHEIAKIQNENTRSGGCRPVDLSAPPFNVKGEYVFKFTADEPKVTFLWKQLAHE